MVQDVLLFDIDGVLLEPHGYRDALPAAIRFWLGENLPDDVLPGHAEMDLFESFGMTNEWDMLAVSMAVLLAPAISADPANRRKSLTQLAQLARERGLIREVNYRQTIESLGQFYQQKGVQMRERRLMYKTPEMAEIFPVVHGTSLYHDLFETIDSIERSELIQVYQTLVLGSEKFQKTYKLIPKFSCDAYLGTRDKVLISEEDRQLLLRAQPGKKPRLAMMTARASRPLVLHEDEVHTWYAPEAEIAMELLGYTALPVIASGHLRYISQALECDASQLLKPSAFHALTSILAAFGIPVLSALNYAAGLSTSTHCGDVKSDRRLTEELTRYIPPEFTVHIVEDSYIGIESAQRAVKVLEESGYKCACQPWGVAVRPEKIKSLERLRAAVFPDITQVISAMGLRDAV